MRRSPPLFGTLAGACLLLSPSVARADEAQENPQPTNAPPDAHALNQPATAADARPKVQYDPNTYSPTYGRGRLIGGGVMLTLATPLLVTSLAWLIVDIVAIRTCDSYDDLCGEYAFFISGATAIPGLLFAGIGVPLVISGLRRRELRGLPLPASERVTWQMTPMLMPRGGGIGLSLQY